MSLRIFFFDLFISQNQAILVSTKNILAGPKTPFQLPLLRVDQPPLIRMLRQLSHPS